MNRVLLADDSPHAQRMGERILREEGFEVVTVSDGDTAMLRLRDFDPDVVIADVSMPGASGYQICEYVKAHLKGCVVGLTASAMEPFDDVEIARVGPDATLKKPFESSLLLELANRAKLTRPKFKEVDNGPAGTKASVRPGRGVVVLDPDQIRAAVTVAMDAALPALVDQITEKVLLSLNLKPYARQ
jgi:DNA-binding response OmpR family regulator